MESVVRSAIAGVHLVEMIDFDSTFSLNLNGPQQTCYDIHFPDGLSRFDPLKLGDPASNSVGNIGLQNIALRRYIHTQPFTRNFKPSQRNGNMLGLDTMTKL